MIGINSVMRICFAFFVVLLFGAAVTQAQSKPVAPDTILTSQMLTHWCRDAHAITAGLNVMPVSQLDQIHSNATSCVGYLRGYLDSEIHIRTLVPQMGPCAVVPDNARLVAIFLNMIDQPGWKDLPLRDLMVEFSNYFCPANVPRMATVIQPSAISGMPQPTKLKMAIMPAIVKSIAPESQFARPYGP